MYCAGRAVGVLIFISCGAVSFSAMGQSNSWTSPVSGYWEDSDWSLGVLPSTNQTIFFTNSGWKALAIGPNTSQNYPQTLTITSLYVSSPGPDTVNTLLLNYSGLQTPLQVAATFNSNFILGTNCYVLMLYSALVVGNLFGGDFSVGGTFNETENSVVSAGILNIGDLAPGVFNLTNSALNVNEEFISGSGFPATFNQQGGTNAAGFLRLYDQYNLYGGDFSGQLLVLGGNFNQYGGDVSASLDLAVGNYSLAGGTLSLAGGDLTIPGPTPPDSFAFGASFSQSGGTNIPGSIAIGNEGGVGDYYLSGGILSATNLDVETAVTPDYVASSTFSQSGGYHTNGFVGIGGTFNMDLEIVASDYEFSGGMLCTPSVSLNMGDFYQTGGTNEAGVISLSSVSLYSLSGGWLYAQTIQDNGGEFYGVMGSILQSGGTNQVGTLSLNNGCFYTLSGGRLTAGQIQIDNAIFNQSLGSSSPGSLDGVNLLTLAGATWNEQSSGKQSFGQLQLSDTNSYLTLPNASCALNFADSSGLVWSNAAALTISNWRGSLYGGGTQQVTFGESAAALTAQQVHQLQFQNPAGLPSGTYPARILATGEVVPDTGATLPLKVTTRGPLTNGAFQLSVEGNIGDTYLIEFSTNLLNWVLWAAVTDSNGTVSITDSNTSNFPRRFYRAQLVP